MKTLVLIAAIAVALLAAPPAMADEKAAPPSGKLSSAKSPAKDSSREKQKLMKSLRKILIDSLKDPASANFKDEFLSLPEDKESQTVSLCGFVNSKNSMGGYSGYAAYIVNTEGMLSVDEPNSKNVILYLSPVWCRRPIP